MSWQNHDYTMSSHFPPIHGKPDKINEALYGVIRYNVLWKNEAGYLDYRAAVFEPALSREQRRLLFGAALRKLDLPLPDGELQPRRRQDF